MSLTYEFALTKLSERLSNGPLEHCKRSADMAALLATVYGVDVDKARIAGLLHDWDRELSGEELLEAERARGEEIEPAEELSPYLLHARLGALSVSRALPGIDADVLRAIERHTLGDPHMTELDMIVYIADTIEPGRPDPGLADIREAIGNVSLNDLFAHAYAFSLQRVLKQRKAIHPATISVWNSVVARKDNA